MSKLYYDDPLISAYMAREFGVVYFENSDIAGKVYNRMTYPQDNELSCFFYQSISTGEIEPHYHQETGETTHYIHPDYYSIFEPREGDVVMLDDGQDVDWYNQKQWDLYGTSIILRDGKHFFMPKRESND